MGLGKNINSSDIDRILVKLNFLIRIYLNLITLIFNAYHFLLFILIQVSYWTIRRLFFKFFSHYSRYFNL
jgi:hypothetical protein